MDATVRPRQRWTREHRCPICGGCDLDPRGQGKRCSGFMGTDGAYAHCSREELSGGLDIERNGITYAHRLEGPCKCGTTHGEAPMTWPASSSSPPAGHRDGKPANGNGHANGNGANGHSRRSPLAGEHETAFWDYETGLRVVRLDGFYDDGKPGKRYVQKHAHADGRHGWGLSPGEKCPPDCKGAARTLYRAPELRAADKKQIVFLVEGEKCVEILRSLGLVATTTPGGADAFHYSATAAVELLRGRHVVVIPDQDEPDKRGIRPGAAYAEKVIEALKPVARSLRLLELPGLKDGEDVEQFLARGHDGEDLVKLAERCPELAPRLLIISDAVRALWANPLPKAEPTGIRGLDKVIGGLRAESMVVLNGPPGKGKTGLAIQAARFISAQGRAVVYLTLELSERQVIARFIAQIRRVPWLRVFELGPSEADALAYDAANLNLRAVRPARTTTIRAVLDRAADELGEAPVVFLDYLQYAATWGGAADLRVAVGALSQDVGTWIVDNHTTGLLISATARTSYKHEDDATAEDFVGAGKESGQIDFDASAELFLESDPCPENGKAPARLHVTKNRFGATNQTVGLIFDGAVGVFQDDPTQTLNELELQCLRAIERGATSAAMITDKDGPSPVKARREDVLKAVRSLRAKGLVDGPPLRRIA